MEHLVRSVDIGQKSKPTESLDAQEGGANLLNRIDELLSEVRNVRLTAVSEGAPDEDPQPSAGRLYASRRAVDACFGMVGFVASPAWDIMLDLFHNEEKRKSVSITSACIGAACASTTALRWLEVLVNMSLIERKVDVKDKRRSYVTLTLKGRDATREALKGYI